jgi:hypothetical protein
MPQVGCSIKLYLPEADENEAFVRFINRKDGASNKKTQDVDQKHLGNDYGKEIKMTPDELKVTASGAMSMKMTAGEGIDITSDKEIKITSDEDIIIDGKKITMTAQESIYSTVKFSSSALHDITHYKADKITINGMNKI